MTYNVIVECPEGRQMVGNAWETRWIPATYRTVDTLAEAQTLAGGLDAHPHPQQRRVWIEQR